MNKEKLKKLMFKSKILPVLDCTYAIDNGRMYLTDMEQTICLNTDKKENGVFNILDNKIYDIEKYPKTPNISKKELLLKIKSNDFVELYSDMSKYADSDNFRPIMSCIYFDKDNDTVASTDSHQAKVVKIQGLQKSFLLPKVFINKIKIILSYNKSEYINIYKSEKDIVLLFDNNDYYAVRCVDGQFPSYMAIIPESFVKKIVVKKEALQEMQDYFKDAKLINKYLIQFIRFDFENKTISHSDIDNNLSKTINDAFEIIDVKYKTDKKNCHLIMPVIPEGCDLKINNKLIPNDYNVIYYNSGNTAVIIEKTKNDTNNNKTKNKIMKTKTEKTEKTVEAVETTVETKNEAKKDLTIVDYSEKAFAVIGATKEYKERLKELNGKFNKYLKCGAGWIFSKKQLEPVKEFINN